MMICQLDNVLSNMKKQGYLLRLPDGSLGKMTQTNLAKILGEQVQTVNMWVAGRTKPPIDKVFRIASILGVSVDDLFKYEPEPEDRYSVVKPGDPLTVSDS